MPSDKPLKEVNKPRIKTYESSTREKVKDPRDELLKKFSKNFRKVLENRENLLADKPSNPGKSVKFDPEVVETSIGGTQSLGRINRSTDSTSSSSFLSSTTTEGNTSTGSGSSSDSFTFNGSLNQSYILNDSSSVNGRVSEGSSILNKRISNPPKPRHSLKGVTTPSRIPTRLTAENTAPSTPECFNPVAFETPLSKAKLRRSSANNSLEHTQDDENSSSVTVAVRVRPFGTR